MSRKIIFAAIFSAAVAMSSAAHAAGEVWQVGDGYVLRLQNLNLDQARDRKKLFAAVNKMARRACDDGAETRGARMRCEDEVKTQVAANSNVRDAYALAQAEAAGRALRCPLKSNGSVRPRTLPFFYSPASTSNFGRSARKVS